MQIITKQLYGWQEAGEGGELALKKEELRRLEEQAAREQGELKEQAAREQEEQVGNQVRSTHSWLSNLVFVVPVCSDGFEITYWSILYDYGHLCFGQAQQNSFARCDKTA